MMIKFYSCCLTNKSEFRRLFGWVWFAERYRFVYGAGFRYFIRGATSEIKNTGVATAGYLEG